MMTGQYPHRHGMVVNPIKDVPNPPKDQASRKNFDSPKELIGDSLKRQGYRIAQMGKWHVGESIAADFGFEGWTMEDYGEPYLSPEYRDYLNRKNLPEPVVRVEWSADEPHLVGKEYNLTHPRKYAFGPFHASRELVTPKETHEAYFLADMASRWLQDHKAQDDSRPFMLKVDTWGPHHPYDVAKPFLNQVNPERIREIPSFSSKHKGKPGNYAISKEFWKGMGAMDWGQMAQVLARVYEHAILVDDALGLILDKLEQLSLLDNTLVILTADHGDIVGTHGGLFNKDNILVEETMKIPLVISWPGRISPGEVSHDLVSNMDIPSTVMAVAGARPEYEVDGINLLKDRRQHLMSQSYGCFRREYVQRMLRWKKYKYIAHAADIDELYDLEEDPFEVNNRVFDQEYQDILNEMRRRLREEMVKLGDKQEEAKEILEKLSDA